jgi:hypothetical protein
MSLFSSPSRGQYANINIRSTTVIEIIGTEAVNTNEKGKLTKTMLRL